MSIAPSVANGRAIPLLQQGKRCERLEVNLPDGESVNIWIQAPAEATTSNSTENTKNTEETEDTGSAAKEERRETAKRIQRLAYFYTVDYVQEMDNKKREAAATEGGEIKCMVLIAENNARVAMGSITDCIAAVNILVNMEEDVDDWMIAGTNATLDKVRVTRGIPFDLSTAICGVLGAQYRYPPPEVMRARKGNA